MGSKLKYRCPYKRETEGDLLHRGEICGSRAEIDLKTLALKRIVMWQKAKDCWQ